MKKMILIAGATGKLGGRIVDALLENNANVRVVVRESEPKKIGALKNKGVEVIQADMLDKNTISKICTGADCVVSALSGLRESIINTQTVLVNAAVEAKVPRFIPSMFSLDFANLVPGTNRNLDLRREFESYLDDAPIATTSIYNGAFMELLTTDMPLILFKFRRVLYWGTPTVKMDLTTIDDVAEYTARVAMDINTPRRLRIAGETVSAADVEKIVSKVTSKRFRLLRAGSISLLNAIINIARFIAPAKNKLYPAWQGMQYMRDMMEGRAEIKAHDNNRYPDMRWTSVEKFMAAQNVRIK